MKKSISSKIIAIVGPTASGKSEAAMQLARKLNAEILSCDSLLVYKGLTIGTAKPSQEEMNEIKHYGIDLIDPTEEFTAGDYVRYARPIIDKCIEQNKTLLIVGGTGFYLKALLCGIWDAPPTQPEFREKLEASVAHLSEEERNIELHSRLKKLDAVHAEKIKANDVYRVIRALEIIQVSGKSVTELLSERELQNPLPYPFKIFGIKRNKIELERRIIERTNQMFSRGLVQETKEILANHTSPPRPFNCVGYREVMQFLSDEMTLPECRERIVISTRQLAKKQMTFFKTFPHIIDWFTLPEQEEEFFTAALCDS